MTAQGIAALAAAMGATNDNGINSGNEDQLRIEMLGAGQEVGRSCCVLSYKGKYSQSDPLMTQKGNPSSVITKMGCTFEHVAIFV